MNPSLTTVQLFLLLFFLLLLLGTTLLMMRRFARRERAFLTVQVAEKGAQIEAERREVEHWRREHQQVLLALREREAQFTAEKRALEEKITLFQSMEALYKESLQTTSLQAMQQNQHTFLHLAENSFNQLHQRAKGEWEQREQLLGQTVLPIKEALSRFDGRLQELEQSRVGAYATLMQQIQTMTEGQVALRSETSNLVKALRAPIVRGRWGEIQLRRVVEMAGMVEHCDFTEQSTVQGEEGRLRPDMIIKLPGQKNIVVDAKTPLSAYLEALETPDEEKKRQRLQEHAKQLRTHIQQLSRKAYWDQFQPTPEFVILFLPGETFFTAALEQDPSLIESGVEQKVLLATPTTLIAILRAIAYGWKQTHLSQTAQKMGEHGRDLYKRLVDMAEHWQKLGKSLSQAVSSYNKAVGSLEARVLVAARRFNDLEPMRHSECVAPPHIVEEAPRPLTSPEMAQEKELCNKAPQGDNSCDK